MHRGAGGNEKDRTTSSPAALVAIQSIAYILLANPPLRSSQLWAQDLRAARKIVHQSFRGSRTKPRRSTQAPTAFAGAGKFLRGCHTSSAAPKQAKRFASRTLRLSQICSTQPHTLPTKRSLSLPSLQVWTFLFLLINSLNSSKRSYAS
jgi:hypothetical protein